MDGRGRARAGARARAYEEGPDIAPVSMPAVLDAPPTEEHLCGSTLWPEVRKLYGHGNEVFACALTPPTAAARLLATSSRSQTADAAAVRVWSCASWRPVGKPLAGHTLTVTQLAFSPDGKLLLSVSRDRSLCVFASASGGDGFELGCRVAKAHARIIWGCAWSPCGEIAVTCSRDKTVKLWRVSAGTSSSVAVEPLASPPAFRAAATAVDCSRALRGARSPSWILAVGLETGEIHLAGWRGGGGAPGLVPLARVGRAHCQAVRRIRFDNRPEGEDREGGRLRLASAGGTTVRVCSVDLSFGSS